MKTLLPLAVFLGLWLSALLLLADDPLGLASKHGPLVLVGALGALVGNATAVGGGIVFVPFMILFYRLDAFTSLQLALVTQAFGMSSGAIGWARRGAVDGAAVRIALLPAAAAVVTGTLLRSPTTGEVKLVFAWVSIAVGFLVLMMLNRESRVDRIPAGAAAGTAVASFFGALVTCWAAIGIGEVVAAWLILRHGLRPERAVATGVVLMAGCSIALAVIHQLYLGGLPWEIAAFVIPGAVVGAQLAPALAHRLPARGLKLFFAVVAIFDGGLILFLAL